MAEAGNFRDLTNAYDQTTQIADQDHSVRAADWGDVLTALQTMWHVYAGRLSAFRLKMYSPLNIPVGGDLKELANNVTMFMTKCSNAGMGPDLKFLGALLVSFFETGLYPELLIGWREMATGQQRLLIGRNGEPGGDPEVLLHKSTAIIIALNGEGVNYTRKNDREALMNYGLLTGQDTIPDQFSPLQMQEGDRNIARVNEWGPELHKLYANGSITALQYVKDQRGLRLTAIKSHEIGPICCRPKGFVVC
jgi:hypothetical protein